MPERSLRNPGLQRGAAPIRRSVLVKIFPFCPIGEPVAVTTQVMAGCWLGPSRKTCPVNCPGRGRHAGRPETVDGPPRRLVDSPQRPNPESRLRSRARSWRFRTRRSGECSMGSSSRSRSASREWSAERIDSQRAASLPRSDSTVAGSWPLRNPAAPTVATVVRQWSRCSGSAGSGPIAVSATSSGIDRPRWRRRPSASVRWRLGGRATGRADR